MRPWSGVGTDPWHTVGDPGEPASFLNGWSAIAGSEVQFRRELNGDIHIEGLVTGGGDNTNAFQLPPGYRPRRPVRSLCYAHATGFALVVVGTTGNVLCDFLTGGTSWINLDDVMTFSSIGGS